MIKNEDIMYMVESQYTQKAKAESTIMSSNYFYA